MQNNAYNDLNGRAGEMINQQLEIINIDNQLFVDSRQVAKVLGIEHESFFTTIKKYTSDLSDFGHLRFEIGTVTNSVGAINKTNYALLNEDQATFLGTLSKNTRQVVTFKKILVKLFSSAKQKLSNPQNIKSPTSYLEALEQLVTTEKKRLALERQIMEEKPLVEFALGIKETTNAISFDVFAKILCKNGLEIGSKRLFQKCREYKILQENNLPYQKYLDSKYFELKEGFYYNSKSGEKVSYTQTLITGLGQEFLFDKLKN